MKKTSSVRRHLFNIHILLAVAEQLRKTVTVNQECNYGRTDGQMDGPGGGGYSGGVGVIPKL